MDNLLLFLKLYPLMPPMCQRPACSHSSLAHPPHWILPGRAFETHSLVLQWTRTTHRGVTSVPRVPSRADLCLTPHSRIWDCGFTRVMWWSSESGFNLRNLLLFRYQSLEDFQSSPKKRLRVLLIAIGFGSIIYLRPQPLLQKYGQCSCYRIPDSSSVICKTLVGTPITYLPAWEGPQALAFQACQKSRTPAASFTCRVCYKTFYYLGLELRLSTAMQHQAEGQRAGISVTHVTTVTLLDQGEWALKQDKADILSSSLTQHQTSSINPPVPLPLPWRTTGWIHRGIIQWPPQSRENHTGILKSKYSCKRIYVRMRAIIRFLRQSSCKMSE